jgi:hypothetical protein
VYSPVPVPESPPPAVEVAKPPVPAVPVKTSAWGNLDRSQPLSEKEIVKLVPPKPVEKPAEKPADKPPEPPKKKGGRPEGGKPVKRDGPRKPPKPAESPQTPTSNTPREIQAPPPAAVTPVETPPSTGTPWARVAPWDDRNEVNKVPAELRSSHRAPAPAPAETKKEEKKKPVEKRKPEPEPQAQPPPKKVEPQTAPPPSPWDKIGK